MPNSVCQKGLNVKGAGQPESVSTRQPLARSCACARGMGNQRGLEKQPQSRPDCSRSSPVAALHTPHLPQLMSSNIKEANTSSKATGVNACVPGVRLALHRSMKFSTCSLRNPANASSAIQAGWATNRQHTLPYSGSQKEHSSV